MQKPTKQELEKALHDFKIKANDDYLPRHIRRNARMAIIILTRQLKEYNNGNI